MSLQPWPVRCSGGNPRSHLSGEIVDIEICFFCLRKPWKGNSLLETGYHILPVGFDTMEEILCSDVNGRCLDLSRSSRLEYS